MASHMRREQPRAVVGRPRPVRGTGSTRNVGAKGTIADGTSRLRSFTGRAGGANLSPPPPSAARPPPPPPLPPPDPGGQPRPQQRILALPASTLRVRPPPTASA